MSARPSGLSFAVDPSLLGPSYRMTPPRLPLPTAWRIILGASVFLWGLLGAGALLVAL